MTKSISPANACQNKRPRLSWAQRGLLLGWSVLLLLLALRSLSWRMVHDLPILHVVGWLISKGRVPYRDLFEMNLPGTWIIHVGGQWLFGADTIGVRLTDLSWLALTLTAAYVCMRCFGLGMGSALLLGTVYLMGGPMDALQRDWLMVGPLLFALAGARWHAHPRMRIVQWSVGGLGLGWAMLIKPQALLLTPLLLGAILWEWQLTRKTAHSQHTELPHATTLNSLVWALVVWLLAQLLPLLMAGLALFRWGALSDFVTLWTQYLGPLYACLDGDGMELEGGLGVYLSSTQLLLQSIWHPSRMVLFGCAGLGSFMLWRSTQEAPQLRIRLGLLMLFVGYGLLHVVIGVKHWWYHWWPAYAGLLLLSTGLLLPGQWAGLRWSLFGLYASAVLGIALLERPQESKMQTLLEPVDVLVSTLRPQLQAGDRVQVLDTVGGGQHAAFLLGLEPATSFLYDFHFFHHREAPFIQALQQRLMRELEQQPPRWVLMWRTSWSHRQYETDLALFPALQTWLTAHYTQKAEHPAWIVYERHDRTTP